MKVEQKNANIYLDMKNMFEKHRIKQSSLCLLRGFHLCWLLTKGLIAAITIITLAGCQPATIQSSSIPTVTKTGSLSQIQQTLPVPKPPLPKAAISKLDLAHKEFFQLNINCMVGAREHIL